MTNIEKIDLNESVNTVHSMKESLNRLRKRNGVATGLGVAAYVSSVVFAAPVLTAIGLTAFAVSFIGNEYLEPKLTKNIMVDQKKIVEVFAPKQLEEFNKTTDSFQKYVTSQKFVLAGMAAVTVAGLAGASVLFPEASNSAKNIGVFCAAMASYLVGLRMQKNYGKKFEVFTPAQVSAKADEITINALVDVGFYDEDTEPSKSHAKKRHRAKR